MRTGCLPIRAGSAINSFLMERLNEAGTKRRDGFWWRSLRWSAALLLVSGCASMPQLLILKDPLSPEEHAVLARSYEQNGEAALAAREHRIALSKEPRSLP